MDAPLLLWLILIISFPAALIINWLVTDKHGMHHDTAGNDNRDAQADEAREIAARRVAART